MPTGRVATLCYLTRKNVQTACTQTPSRTDTWNLTDLVIPTARCEACCAYRHVASAFSYFTYTRVSEKVHFPPIPRAPHSQTHQTNTKILPPPVNVPSSVIPWKQRQRGIEQTDRFHVPLAQPSFNHRKKYASDANGWLTIQQL